MLTIVFAKCLFEKQRTCSHTCDDQLNEQLANLLCKVPYLRRLCEIAEPMAPLAASTLGGDSVPASEVQFNLTETLIIFALSTTLSM